jgi:hypothetical protein
LTVVSVVGELEPTFGFVWWSSDTFELLAQIFCWPDNACILFVGSANIDVDDPDNLDNANDGDDDRARAAVD